MIQLALITGGAVQSGRSISFHLAKLGYAIAIQYNNSNSEAAQTVTEIASLGGKAACFQASLADHDSVEDLIPQVVASMGPLTCLVNNATHFVDDRIQSLTEESWRLHMAINLEAPILLSKAFAAQLPDGHPGNIVNIIDQRVLRPNPLYFSYTLSKSALRDATKILAQAFAPQIRVNAIGQAPTHARCAVPLGQGTTQDEIAEAVLFILKAEAMTGQMIALDGGRHLLWQTPDVDAT